MWKNVNNKTWLDMYFHYTHTCESLCIQRQGIPCLETTWFIAEPLCCSMVMWSITHWPRWTISTHGSETRKLRTKFSNSSYILRPLIHQKKEREHEKTNQVRGWSIRRWSIPSSPVPRRPAGFQPGWSKDFADSQGLAWDWKEVHCWTSGIKNVYKLYQTTP